MPHRNKTGNPPGAAKKNLKFFRERKKDYEAILNRKGFSAPGKSLRKNVEGALKIVNESIRSAEKDSVVSDPAPHAFSDSGGNIVKGSSPRKRKRKK